jgi:hypothetical protein
LTQEQSEPNVYGPSGPGYATMIVTTMADFKEEDPDGGS